MKSIIQISFDANQIDALKEEKAQTGKSVASIVRLAVDKFLTKLPAAADPGVEQDKRKQGKDSDKTKPTDFLL